LKYLYSGIVAIQFRDTTMHYTTNKQVEIERLEDCDKWNYHIVGGNPLNGEKDFEIFANYLSINGFGMATSYLEISQYGESIEVHKTGPSVDITVNTEE